MTKLNCSIDDIGTVKLRNLSRQSDHLTNELSKKHDLHALQLIKRAFEMDEENIRVDHYYDFHRGEKKKNEKLNVGDVLTGIVTNITGFGAFMDLGGARDGLLHITKFDKKKKLIPNQKHQIRIEKINERGDRISLELAWYTAW